MITIQAVQNENGSWGPETPIEDAAPVIAAVICNGSTYTVYEPGDTLPTTPAAPSA